MKVRDLQLYLRYSLSKDILLRFIRSNLAGLIAIFVLVNLIDFYDYLSSGVLDKDLNLINNDVIYIPTELKRIAITGSVNNEGYFELKDSNSLEVYGDGNEVTSISIAPFIFEAIYKENRQ